MINPDAGEDVDVFYDEGSHQDEQHVDTRAVMTAYQAALIRRALDFLGNDDATVADLRKADHLAAQALATLHEALRKAEDER